MVAPELTPGSCFPDFANLAAAWLDDDAIKLSIATSVAAASYSAAALDGVTGVGALPGRSAGVSITTSAHASTYNIVDPIVVTGLNWRSEVISENVFLTATGGGEVVQTTKGFYKVTSVAFPPQVDALGTFKIGVKDLLFQPAARAFHAGKSATGDYKVTSPRGQAATLTLALGFYPLGISKIDSTQADFPFVAFR